MKLIHKWDKEKKVWFNELYDKKGNLINKKQVWGAPTCKVNQKITIKDKIYVVTKIDRSAYSATRLIIEFEDFEDWLEVSVNT
ncbi:hypothetical protein ABEY43_06995 [Priestia megaterium]